MVGVRLPCWIFLKPARTITVMDMTLNGFHNLHPEPARNVRALSRHRVGAVEVAGASCPGLASCSLRGPGQAA